MAQPNHGASASSSISVAQPLHCDSALSSYRHWDVFINHYGDDVKDNFAGYLHDKLKNLGFQVFLDRPEMKHAQPIDSQIEAAIKAAAVHIAIFSPGYAKSDYCLRELVLMKRSSGRILPVFYDVKPSDLKDSGAYAKYLDEQKTQEIDNIKQWKAALDHARQQVGFELKTYNRDQVKLLKYVVKCVRNFFSKSSYDGPKYPTGLKEKIREFEKKMLSPQKEEPVKARVVGIVGSGGVGKTMFAHEFFNTKGSDYDESSLLLNVKAFKESELYVLQNTLIEDLKHHDSKIKSGQGLKILKKELKTCRALIILDDVDSKQQLDAFLPIKDDLHCESLILVTSQDRQVLRSADIVEPSIYTLTGLNAPQSEELFCRHAFNGRRDPPPEFKTLVNEFLEVCHGLPLFLTLLGTLLCNQDKLYWESQLKGIDRTLPAPLQNSLRIIYNSLDHEEKQIFLDIACFSIGKDKDTWIRIWDESDWAGYAGFQNLIDKCIVAVDGENKIQMHDLLKNLGRMIVRDSSERPRRLLGATINDIRRLLHQSSEVREQVRGIRMSSRSSGGDTSDEGLLPSKLESPLNELSQLKLLEAEGDFVKNILTCVQLPNLIWLSWNDCPFDSLASIPMKSLRVLEVAGKKLKKLWDSNSQAPSQLRELYIEAPFLEFSKHLGELKQLEKLVVEHSMDKETQLATLPEELGSLCCLKYLKLKGCSQLQTIPDKLRELTNLQQIDLSACTNLRSLSVSLEKLINLQHINLSRCESLEELPDSLENFSKLLHIDLSDCTSLAALPNSFKNLTELRYINLSGCNRLQGLPTSFQELTNLKHVDLSKCERLEELPACKNLRNLQDINLSGCGSLKKLPDFFGNLIDIQDINLDGCTNLEELPDSFGSLISLQTINLQGCKSLKEIPDSFGGFTDLQRIDLEQCQSLTTLPQSFEKLTKLRDINLQSCRRLKMLPDIFGNLTNLEHINLSICKSLEMLPNSFENLVQLKHLDLRGCRSLTIRSERLKTVAELYLGKNLGQLSCDLGCLSKLEVLLFEDPLLNELPPSLGKLTSLKELLLNGCLKLQSLAEGTVGRLIQLRVLEIQNCGIQDLPQDLLKLNNLERLEVSHCPLGQLPFRMVEASSEVNETGMLELKELHLDSLRISKVWFPQGVCPKLRDLRIRDCDCIVEVGALPTSVKVLDLRGCAALRSIKEFNLHLHAYDIRQLEQLLELETLKISSCTELQSQDGQEEELRCLATLTLYLRARCSNCFINLFAIF